MTSLPSIIPADVRPADLEALWETAVNAADGDDAPWQVMADYCDEHGWHGLAAACRHPRGNWFAGHDDEKDDMAILITRKSGWWAIRYKGSQAFNIMPESAYYGDVVDWERLEPVLRADA